MINTILNKSVVGFFLLTLMVFQGCKTSESRASKVIVSDGKAISKYLKTIQYSEDGKHLFGHESTIMMGGGGDLE